MHERIARRRPSDGTSSTSTGHADSSFERLAPELQEEAYRRLSGAALVYALTYSLFFLLDWAWLVRQEKVLCGPGMPDLVRALVSIGGAFVIHVGARRQRIPAHKFLRLAVTFQVVGAYGIVGGLWGWPLHVDMYLQALVDSGLDLEKLGMTGARLFGMSVGGGVITWGAIWMLVFPLSVPMPRRWAMIGSLLTASVVPGVIVASHLWHGIPDSVRPHLRLLYMAHLIPNYVIAAMAIHGSTVSFRLRSDLSKERRLGAYRLVKRIGRGGMGEVWRASHRMLARPAAVKLIRPEALGGGSGGGTSRGSTTARKRFEREAQATAALVSPHTIEVYDFGVADDGTFYYVMELLDGIDLKTLIERYGPLPSPRVAAILKQACHSLADAHATGLVHRDVKPANLFLCRRGLDRDFVKVLDFGLVKDVGSAGDARTQITVEGVTSGTPAFMAPEMAVGSPTVDGRADLYALGCVAYWLLTGQLVFEGENAMAILLQHARDVPARPSTRTELEIPGDLEDLVMEMLEKNADSRPTDAREVHRRLVAIEADSGRWTPERAEQWWTTHRPVTSVSSEESGEGVSDEDPEDGPGEPTRGEGRG